MQPATLRESDAMLVDANDGPTAPIPQYHSHSVNKGFPKLVRGPTLYNQKMSNIIFDSRPPTPSPSPFNPPSHSPTMMKTSSPTPNYPQNMSVFPPRRKLTQVFGGAFEALERVINRTRKRERITDDFETQIADGNSSQYDSFVESVTRQPPKKMPRQGTLWPSSLLFAPPGLERRTERPVASPPNLNPPIFSSPQPSILGHVRPAAPRPDDHKKRKQFRTTRLVHRSPMAKPAQPLKHRLSTLKDFLLPHPFGAHPQAPQFNQTTGDDTIAVLPPVPPDNDISNATGVPIVKPTPLALPVCSDPKSLYYDGEEPKTRCESPEQIPEYYDHSFSGTRPSIGYSTGGNRCIRRDSIYGDPYAMDVVAGRKN